MERVSRREEGVVGVGLMWKKQETETSGSMNSMDEQGIASLTRVRRGEHQVHELM